MKLPPWATATVTTLLLAVPAAARAQNINLTQGGADLIWRGSTEGARAGQSLDQGAVNSGDNRPDLIIGAPGQSTVPGKVYIVFGGRVRSGLLSLEAADVRITGASNGDGFGTATAAGNILTSTGPRDLIVSAPSALSGRGIVYLFAGGFTVGQSLTTANAAFRIEGAVGDQLGASLATGDIDGDGLRELILGAPGSHRVYIIYGAGGLSGVRDLNAGPADVTINGAGVGGIVRSGEITGDAGGRYDIIIGAPAADGNKGAVYVVDGEGGTLPATLSVPANADRTFFGLDPGDRVGSAIAIGDFDSDDRRDLAIGAPGGDGPGNARAESGEAYVMWNGAQSRTLGDADVTIYGALATHRLGSELASGDINRDTPNDLMLLAPGNPGSGGDVMVYYGRARTRMGYAAGARRVVDFAIAGEVSRRILGDTDVGPIAALQVFEFTGEGARDLIVSIPTAASPGGATSGRVYFVVSPKLVPSASTFAFSATGSRTLQINNPSVVGITWTATVTPSTATWVRTVPYGTAAGSSAVSQAGLLTLSISTAGLAAGTYTATVSVRSTSEHLEMTAPLSITLTVPAGGGGGGTPPPSGQDLPDPRVVLGLGRYAPNSGWMSVRTGSATGNVLSAWLRLPWPSYNVTNGELHPATGDVDGDGLDEIVVGLGTGGQGWIAVFDDAVRGNALMRWIQVQWPSYNASNGAVYPAVGDFDGDGRAEIAAGFGVGGQGYLEIFDDAGTGFRHVAWPQVGWPSYNRANGETHPAAGDIDGDGRAELIVGLSSGSAGYLQVFEGADRAFQHVRWLQIGWPSYNAASGRTWPAVGDLDGDGRAEILVGLGQGSEGFLQLFDDGVNANRHVRWLQVGWSAYNTGYGETHPAIGNLDADASAEIAIGLGPHPWNGGWWLSHDDASTGYRLLRWNTIAWDEYAASGGQTFPAIGRLK